MSEPLVTQARVFCPDGCGYEFAHCMCDAPIATTRRAERQLVRKQVLSPLNMDDHYEVRSQFQLGKGVSVASASELVQTIQSFLDISQIDEVTVQRVQIVQATLAPQQEPTP